MHKFGYRSPRFAINLPVKYTVGDVTAAGHCIEISIEGMTLELQQALPPDAVGTVSIPYQDRTLELDVRVVHESGMEFVYESDSERKAVSHLIGLLTAPKDRPGPVLLT